MIDQMKKLCCKNLSPYLLKFFGQQNGDMWREKINIFINCFPFVFSHIAHISKNNSQKNKENKRFSF